MKKIAIVILNWNGSSFLERFLPGVIQHSSALSRVIVADNGSNDNSIDLLKNHFPSVEVLSLERNHGFTGGYNRALSMVESEYFLLLNSDVEVTENWLEPLLNFMECHPEVAACQPKIRSLQDRHLFEHAGGSGGFIDILGYPFCRGRMMDTLEEDKGQYDDAIPVFWATGACMLIRSADFNAMNGFDERYFAHMEEIDLCWRLQRCGRSIFVVPASSVYHVGGGTLSKKNPRKTFFNFRNNLLMLSKNLPLRTKLWLIPARLILDGLAGIKFLIDGDWNDTIAVIKAHLAFYSMSFHSVSGGITEKSVKIKGVFKGSILIEYFLRKKRFFHQLSTSKISS